MSSYSTGQHGWALINYYRGSPLGRGWKAESCFKMGFTRHRNASPRIPPRKYPVRMQSTCRRFLVATEDYSGFDWYDKASDHGK